MQSHVQLQFIDCVRELALRAEFLVLLANHYNNPVSTSLKKSAQLHALRRHTMVVNETLLIGSTLYPLHGANAIIINDGVYCITYPQFVAVSSPRIKNFELESRFSSQREFTQALHSPGDCRDLVMSSLWGKPGRFFLQCTTEPKARNVRSGYVR